MFNISKIKESQVATEKYLREEDVAPQNSNKPDSTTEKTLDHKIEKLDTTTEDQLKNSRKESDIKIIEKVLDEAKSSYTNFRDDSTWLSVPPIAALVEKNRQDQMKTIWKTDNQEHWTVSFDDKEQLGDLPRSNKIKLQHDNMVLGNDPRRFESLTVSNNIIEKGKIQPMVGDIKKSDLERVASSIKSGESLEHDTVIIAILKQAEKEQRELTLIEQQEISRLKIARTNKLLKYAKSN